MGNNMTVGLHMGILPEIVWWLALPRAYSSQKAILEKSGHITKFKDDPVIEG